MSKKTQNTDKTEPSSAAPKDDVSPELENQQTNNLEQPTEPTEQQSEGEQLRAQLALATAKNLSLMADFENFRRRTESEKSAFVAMGNAMLVNEIAQIYDDLQMALNDESLNLESARAAITSAQSKINSGLQVAGVQQITINKGDKFDSSTMEAIAQLTVANMQGLVIDVVSSGLKYANKDGLIRSAKVVVGK
jgi:molecular chaperone GrpE